CGNPLVTEVMHLLYEFRQNEFRSFFGKRSRQVQDLIKSLPSDVPVFNQYECLEHPVFLLLVKDIWLNALRTGNSKIMDRISHLMVSYTKRINSSRQGIRHFLKKLDAQLEHIHLLQYNDLSVLAFLLVTNPRRWEENKQHVFQQLIRHAFANQESKLKTCPYKWEADVSQQLSISHWAESEVIPDTISTLRFLMDIASYIDDHNHRFPADTPERICRDDDHWSERLSRGKYFDKDTKQLLSPIIAPGRPNLFPLEETREVLADYFRTSFGLAGDVSANHGNAHKLFT
ncbi:hypothetical protein, partial [Endozoicomonas sp. ONNA2]|uniref:hypothetical protein n=1 Tax=Endozoicomonas sp. ONNA2 TaxID=2828741 RepID=UPI00214721AA